MMLNRPAHLLGIIATVVGIFSNSLATATQPPGGLPQAIDITLNRNGLLTGRIVDPRGQAIAHTDVVLIANEEVLSLVTSDATGYFRVPNMRPGTYRLASNHAVQICRVWAPGTAPPAAKQSALLVANKEVTAGQVAPLKYWLANPSVMLGIAAIAIVVPIVVFNISQDRQASP